MYSRSALSSEYIRPAGSGGSSMLCSSLPCGRREWRVLRHNLTTHINSVNEMNSYLLWSLDIWCQLWSHSAYAVQMNIAYHTVLLFYRAWVRSHLPSVKESFYFLSTPSQDQFMLAHHWAPETRAIPKKIAAPQYFSSMRLVTSAFHSIP